MDSYSCEWNFSFHTKSVLCSTSSFFFTGCGTDRRLWESNIRKRLCWQQKTHCSVSDVWCCNAQCHRVTDASFSRHALSLSAKQSSYQLGVIQNTFTLSTYLSLRTHSSLYFNILFVMERTVHFFQLRKHCAMHLYLISLDTHFQHLLRSLSGI